MLKRWICCAVVATSLLGGVSVFDHAEGADSPLANLKSLIKAGDRDEVLRILSSDNSELVNGTQLEDALLESLRANNYDIASDLVSHGANWLAENKSGLAFCELASTGSPEDRGSFFRSIQQRLKSEADNLKAGLIKQFIDGRLRSRQANDYNTMTASQCGQLITEFGQLPELEAGFLYSALIESLEHNSASIEDLKALFELKLLPSWQIDIYEHKEARARYNSLLLVKDLPGVTVDEVLSDNVNLSDFFDISLVNAAMIFDAVVEQQLPKALIESAGFSELLASDLSKDDNRSALDVVAIIAGGASTMKLQPTREIFVSSVNLVVDLNFSVLLHYLIRETTGTQFECPYACEIDSRAFDSNPRPRLSNADFISLSKLGFVLGSRSEAGDIVPYEYPDLIDLLISNSKEASWSLTVPTRTSGEQLKYGDGWTKYIKELSAQFATSFSHPEKLQLLHSQYRVLKANCNVDADRNSCVLSVPPLLLSKGLDHMPLDLLLDEYAFGVHLAQSGSVLPASQLIRLVELLESRDQRKDAARLLDAAIPQLSQLDQVWVQLELFESGSALYVEKPLGQQVLKSIRLPIVNWNSNGDGSRGVPMEIARRSLVAILKRAKFSDVENFVRVWSGSLAGEDRYELGQLLDETALGEQATNALKLLLE